MKQKIRKVFIFLKVFLQLSLKGISSSLVAVDCAIDKFIYSMNQKRKLFNHFGMIVDF